MIFPVGLLLRCTECHMASPSRSASVPTIRPGIATSSPGRSPTPFIRSLQCVAARCVHHPVMFPMPHRATAPPRQLQGRFLSSLGWTAVHSGNPCQLQGRFLSSLGWAARTYSSCCLRGRFPSNPGRPAYPHTDHPGERPNRPPV